MNMNLKDEILSRENEMRAALQKLSSDKPPTTEDTSSARKYEAKIAELEGSIEKLRRDNVALVSRHTDLTHKFQILEEEHVALLGTLTLNIIKNN